MTGDKDYHKRDDPRFYFFDSNDKLRIDNPIWIPTKYLNQINFNLMTGQNKTQETMDKITKIYNQFNEAIKNKDEI
jgi:hypothetical protein